jgi:hypothetical protein
MKMTFCSAKEKAFFAKEYQTVLGKKGAHKTGKEGRKGKDRQRVSGHRRCCRPAMVNDFNKSQTDVTIKSEPTTVSHMRHVSISFRHAKYRQVAMNPPMRTYLYERP